MQSKQTFERTDLPDNEYIELVDRMRASSVQIEELTAADGSKTVRLPHEVYLAERHRIQAKQRQQNKAKETRRKRKKQAASSRRRN